MISTTFLPSVPQQFINVDRDKVLKQGVTINDVYQTIQAYMGGLQAPGRCGPGGGKASSPAAF